MYSVYILKSEKDNGFYIGCTEDLEDRIKRHNSGRSKATRHRCPFILKRVEQFSSKTEAYKREKYLKKQKSKKYIENLISMGQ